MPTLSRRLNGDLAVGPRVVENHLPPVDAHEWVLTCRRRHVRRVDDASDEQLELPLELLVDEAAFECRAQRDRSLDTTTAAPVEYREQRLHLDGPARHRVLDEELEAREREHDGAVEQGARLGRDADPVHGDDVAVAAGPEDVDATDRSIVAVRDGDLRPSPLDLERVEGGTGEV